MQKTIPRVGTFWNLIFSNNKDLRHIEDYDVDHLEFPYLDIKRGKPYLREIPSSFRLYLYRGAGPLADQLANPMGLAIWSDRLVKHLWPLVQNCVQLLPAPIFEHSGEPVPGYHLVNVIKVFDCVDLPKSPKERDSLGHFIMPSDACIDPSRTGGAAIFKWVHPNGDVDTGITVSYEFVKSLEKTGLTGLAAIPYKRFDD